MTLASVFTQILNMSITASIVLLVVLLLRAPLKKAPKWISYALWAVVLFRLVCPISFQSNISAFRDIGGHSFTQNSFGNPAYIQQPPAASMQGIGGGVTNSIAGAFEPATAAGGLSLQAILPVLAWVWVAGICAMLLYGVISYFLLRRKLIGATLVEPGVYETDAIRAPFMLGVLSPRIYLPLGLVGEERAHVLRHERAHIRRRDYMVKLVSFAVLTLHWFNPLLWAAYHLLCADMEVRCDDAVVQELAPAGRMAYSETLLRFAVGQNPLPGVPLAFGEGKLKSRVKNILENRKPAFWVGAVAVAAAAVVAIALMANPVEANSPAGAPGLPVVLAAQGANNAPNQEQPVAAEANDAAAYTGMNVQCIVGGEPTVTRSVYMRHTPEWHELGERIDQSPPERASIWEHLLLTPVTGAAEEEVLLYREGSGCRAIIGDALYALPMEVYDCFDSSFSYTSDVALDMVTYHAYPMEAGAILQPVYYDRLEEWQEATGALIAPPAGAADIRYEMLYLAAPYSEEAYHPIARLSFTYNGVAYEYAQFRNAGDYALYPQKLELQRPVVEAATGNLKVRYDDAGACLASFGTLVDSYTLYTANGNAEDTETLALTLAGTLQEEYVDSGRSESEKWRGSVTLVSGGVPGKSLALVQGEEAAELVDTLLFQAMVKSAAWPAPELTEVGEYLEIRKTYYNGEESVYYAYRYEDVYWVHMGGMITTTGEAMFMQVMALLEL